MTNAHAISSAPPETATTDWLEQTGMLSLFGVAAALQFSIAIAQILLTVTVLCWLSLVISRKERVEVPRFFWFLVAYGAITLVSAAFSPEPVVSLIDCKQLVLFLLVPLTYRFFTGDRGSSVITLAVSVGAASAAIGIFQYAVLHYDLQYRPRGTLGHYMTFSGLLMLVIGCGLARIVFGKRDRLWALLVMPALAFAVALTFTRSAAVGACAAAALLFTLKDFRLLAILPVVGALLFAAAPAQVAKRFSTLSLTDLSVTDRGAMLREGIHMIEAHPLVGVGPNMVEELYAQYRDPRAVNQINPHLHNVPLQIAAERGLPALAIWLAFIVVLLKDVATRFFQNRSRVLAAAALAAIVAMLAAGMFEYNFGDSEFLMFFLILVTLPFAAGRPAPPDSASAA
ncbi:MAG TPA: O-antigen ligase family protein [Vicinamibacterales bacterium]|jgi:O-antigen ligase|nr:O-antigen ligase family protein [Vicinamibacterales bacterium]